MLENKVAIVTGAGRGIGEAIVRMLAAKGSAVVVSDIDSTVAEAVAADIRAQGCKAVAVRTDVSNEDDAARLAKAAVEHFGQLDILVNNAGLAITKLFMETTKADMERILAVNLIGALLCAQSAVKEMLPRGHGRVINITSVSGQRGGTARSAYGSSKAALELLTKVMSVELAASGITVNNVAPAAVATPMAVQQHDEETTSAYRYLMPQRRYGTPEEIANVVAFLASDEASHVTGTTINVDGGFLGAGLMYRRKGVDAPPAPIV